MEKLSRSTQDITQENIDKIAELFPDCIVESFDGNCNLHKSVDFDVLKQNLSGNIVEGACERYQFTWPGKQEAKLKVRQPIHKTLLPQKDKSLNWDNTENVYIEGDNLDALKLMRETYMHKIKVIYIDPPYNTGKDFIYKDNRAISSEEYSEMSGDYDDDGGLLVSNPESNGRFHSDWCSMIYSRLSLARDLLTNDGVIFISIDDHEQSNLKKICDEIFGSLNFVAQIVWERAYSPVNLKKHFSESHDYIICYAKNKELCVCNGLPRSEEANDRYDNPDDDPRGPWTSGDLSVGPRVESKVYEITAPSGRKILPPSGYCWRLDQKTFEKYVKDKRIWFGLDGNNVPRIKRFLSEVKQGITPMTVWKYSEVGHSQGAAQQLKKLFDGKSYFDYPKSVELIKRCLQLYTDSNSIILDFFSGSATTAQAVMELNSEDSGNRKFIMVQLPELINEKSEAFKDGYTNICDLGEERIVRAGKKIVQDVETYNKQLVLGGESRRVPDIGFRVFKVDSSNIDSMETSPKNTIQSLLLSNVDNLKPGRSSEDLLFEALPKFRIPYSASIETKTVDSHTLYYVEDTLLIACLDDQIDSSLIEYIAKKKPFYALFKDGAFDDATKTNLREIFNMFSSHTILKVF